MKLNSLYIDKYKLLKDFNIDFKKDVSILIGINGSGKSSIMEAVVQIFSDAILNQKPKFGFKIKYELRLEEILDQSATTSKFKTDYIGVEISADQQGADVSYKVSIADEVIETKEQIENRFKKFTSILPSNIVIYYSGQSEIMRNICEPHIQQFAISYQKGITDIPQFFFYYEPDLFGILLLSLLSFEYGDIPVFLNEKAQIKKLKSAQIYLKKPEWSKDRLINWWGAKGEVKKLFDFLYENSTTNKNLENNSKEVILESVLNNLMRITLSSQKMLFLLKEYFVEEKELFKVLYALYIGDFLSKIEFSFESNNSSFGILSEGEQQTLIIKGLSELATNENTLFLFDEPDTYLHPSWQKNFIEGIVQFSELSNENMNMSQFLITTHSPQLLSNADPEKSEVQIIEDGEIVKITPKYYGRDISTILYELMGVERRNKKVTKELSNLFSLIDDEKLEQAKLEYQRLSDLLGVDDPVIIRAKTQLTYLEESKNEANK